MLFKLLRAGRGNNHDPETESPPPACGFKLPSVMGRRHRGTPAVVPDSEGADSDTHDGRARHSGLGYDEWPRSRRVQVTVTVTAPGPCSAGPLVLRPGPGVSSHWRRSALVGPAQDRAARLSNVFVSCCFLVRLGGGY